MLLILLPALPARAQPGLVQVSGSVSDKDTRQPLPGATVRKRSQPQATVADAAGRFSLRVRDTDTLEFRVVGYETQQLVLGRTGLAQLVVQVQLRRASILLAGVTVREGRPDDAIINRALRNIRRPPPPVVSQVKRPPKPRPLFPVDSIAPREPAPTLQNPVSFLYDQFSRAGMQRRKLAGIMARQQQEARQQHADSSRRVDNPGAGVPGTPPGKAAGPPLAPAPPVQPPAGSLAPRT